MAREPRARELRQFLHDLYFAMRGLLYLDCVHKDNPKPEQIPVATAGHYDFEKLIASILEAAGAPLGEVDGFHLQRDAFLLDLIGNTICADLLDYAKRDSHFAGLRLDYDAQRIVENFTLVSHKDAQGGFPVPFIRTAISLFSHKLRLDSPGELLNLLQVRYYLSERVLYHLTWHVA